jgi:hypothetical protein
MGLDPYANASYETNPYANTYDRDRANIHMAQQQERFQVRPKSTPEVMHMTTLNTTIEQYENLLGGLMEQLDMLEKRLVPVLLDAALDARPSTSVQEITGASLTIRMSHLNGALQNAITRTMTLHHCLNI